MSQFIKTRPLWLKALIPACLGALALAMGGTSCGGGGGAGGGGGSGSGTPSAWKLITPAEMLQAALADEIDQFWGFDGVTTGYYSFSDDRVYIDGIERLDFDGNYAYITAFGSAPGYFVHNGPSLTINTSPLFVADTYWGLAGGYPSNSYLSWGVDQVQNFPVAFMNTTGFELQATYIDTLFGTEISGYIIGGGFEWGWWRVTFNSPNSGITTDPSYIGSVDAVVDWHFYAVPFVSFDGIYW